MTDLDQASVMEIAISEGVVNVQKTFDLSIETLLLNIDIYIEATLIVAKKRRTRRVHRLNDALRITIIQVRDALHAHFATEGYIAKLYDEERHDDRRRASVEVVIVAARSDMGAAEAESRRLESALAEPSAAYPLELQIARAEAKLEELAAERETGSGPADDRALLAIAESVTRKPRRASTPRSSQAVKGDI